MFLGFVINFTVGWVQFMIVLVVKTVPMLSFFSKVKFYHIILMNFSNYINPFYTLPTFIDQSFYPFQPFNYSYPPPIPMSQPVEASNIVKSETISKEVDRKKLIEKLQAFHYDQIHHKKTHWTAQQDKLLERLIEIQKLEWRDIPKYFQGRTQNMCYSRYRRILMSTKERSWSKQDEDLILQLINRYGEKWKLISSKVTKFTSKQIRERYLNYLRPNINKEEFTLAQDIKICQYVLGHGNHWRQMEQILEGRPQGLIKGRYYGRLQKIIEQCYVEPKN